MGKTMVGLEYVQPWETRVEPVVVKSFGLGWNKKNTE